MSEWEEVSPNRWESDNGTIIVLKWDDEGFTYWETRVPGDPNRYRYPTLEESMSRTELREG